ncbi:MAG: hypothetical protein HRT54_04760 [Colwellia sp.]|nr:hypothetical protein [Colwellia sp.]
MIQSNEQSIFYSGDSGYFKGFKEIGHKYEPLERITTLARIADIEGLTPIIGEPIDITSDVSYQALWHGLN